MLTAENNNTSKIIGKYINLMFRQENQFILP